ncbi:RNase H family protein [Bacillus sp. CGMCC 1.16541]|uniref:RNase H family protein n=1 Tax=Bacillus sp. CGMCC 1.16541 TaxID=2185143 RepID=UPI000D73E00B|nr:RNase H family protein [Bacillus sp. CGMCC 1.16541]
MKAKGNVKRVGKVNFWRGREHRIPVEIKEVVLQQYYSIDALYVYCDSSCRTEGSKEMAVACTYVTNGSVIVKQYSFYPPYDCIGKNIYGELKAIMFGIKHFQKHMGKNVKNVVIYSDVNNIEQLISKEVIFRKNETLSKLQSELISLYEAKKKEYCQITISIQYLSTHQKKHNPFMKASHNACYTLLKRK